VAGATRGPRHRSPRAATVHRGARAVTVDTCKRRAARGRSSNKVPRLSPSYSKLRGGGANGRATAPEGAAFRSAGCCHPGGVVGGRAVTSIEALAVGLGPKPLSAGACYNRVRWRRPKPLLANAGRAGCPLARAEAFAGGRGKCWCLPAQAEAFAGGRGKCRCPVTVDLPRRAGPVGREVRRRGPCGRWLAGGRLRRASKLVRFRFPRGRVAVSVDPPSGVSEEAPWGHTFLSPRPLAACLLPGWLRTTLSDVRVCMSRRPRPEGFGVPPPPLPPEGWSFVGGGCLPEGVRPATGAASEEGPDVRTDSFRLVACECSRKDGWARRLDRFSRHRGVGGREPKFSNPTPSAARPASWMGGASRTLQFGSRVRRHRGGAFVSCVAGARSVHRGGRGCAPQRLASRNSLAALETHLARGPKPGRGVGPRGPNCVRGSRQRAFPKDPFSR